MFSSPILGKGSIGFPVQYCVNVVYVHKSNTGKGFYVPQSTTGKMLYSFTSLILRKGSRFPSPIVGKGCSFPSPVLEKGCRFPSPCSTGKRFFRFLSPTLGKCFIGSPVHYWEKVLGSPV